MRLLTLLAGCFLATLSCAQSITVTSPNGGEVFQGCTTETITWVDSGTSNFYSIDYSVDGGSSWTSIATFYNTTSGSYNWQVPSIQALTALIRVQDSNNASIEDESNNTFTLAAPRVLTSPNGGEVWQGGSVQQITWVSSGTSSYSILEYSVDAGNTWIEINDYFNSTSGTYNWTVPNTPTPTALVRIQDYNNTCKADQSDFVFEISPATPVIQVTSPDGGEQWYYGQTKNISWNSSFVTSNQLQIEYTLDDGASWTLLAPLTENDGSYSWLLPSVTTSLARVRVTDLANPATFGVSGAPFSIIEPYINVLGPTAGESFPECGSVTISWEHGGTINNRFNITYSQDDGLTWSTIVTNYYQTSTTNSSYTWAYPAIEGPAIFRVSDFSDASVESISDEVNFIPNNEIFITSPNGGEQWEVGTVQSIMWAVAPGISYADLYYTLDDGNTEVELNDYFNTSPGSMNWSVPNSPSTQARFRIRNYNHQGCEQDQSDAVFSIVPPTPVIDDVQPGNSANQVYYNSKAYSINWSSEYLSGNFVAIDLSNDDGATWEVLTTLTEDDGSFPFNPSTLTTTGRIRVREIGTSIEDISDFTFSVEDPYIQVLGPAAGESFAECGSVTISWEHQGSINNRFNVAYSQDDGLTWTNIVLNYYQTSTTNSSYTWTYPAIEGPAIFRVHDYSDASVVSISDAVSFIPNDEIFITSPNGGEQWQVGTVQSITWVVAPGISYADLYYTIDDGNTWVEVNDYFNTSSGSMNWSVPNSPSTQARFRIRNYNHEGCEQDQSDAVFSIVPPTQLIDDVNPGNSANQVYYSSKAYNINWNSEYLTGNFVAIDLSNDDGATWEVLTTLTEDDGSFPFNPSALTTNGRIRVREIGTSIEDISDFTFSAEDPYIQVLGPTAGESFAECGSVTITWEHQGSINNRFNIAYSQDDGLTWTNIVLNYYQTSTTNSSYTWTYPAIEGPAIFRVHDYSDASVASISDAVNFIPNDEIFITSPNGGESWEVGTTQSITWVSAAGINYADLFYSLDDGNTWIEINDYFNASSGAMNWSVPNVTSSECRIRIRNYNHEGCEQDQSDTVFTIAPPTPVISNVSPGGSANQVYYTSKSASISWSSAYLDSEFVAIDLSNDNGLTWEVLTPVTEDDGSFIFYPSVLTTEALVRVREIGSAVEAVSAFNFSVEDPFIQVLGPLSGASFAECGSVTITWEHRGSINNRFNVAYSQDDGLTWSNIVTNYYQTSATNSNYTWNYPAIEGPAIFRVHDYSDASVESISDEVNFIPNNEIFITSPNGGEQWEVGTVQSITWVVAPGINYADLYYTLDDGNTWIEVNDYFNTSAGSMNWSVPNSPSTEARFRIRNYNHEGCELDQSDAVFSIVPPTQLIDDVQPGNSANQVYYNSKAYSITWNSEYLTGNFVAIDLSNDDGATWEVLTTLTEDDGSFPFNPSTLTTTGRIRVREIGTSIEDISDFPFAVEDPYINVLGPTAGESFGECGSMTISWEHRGSINNRFNIAYSQDDGLTWSNIVTNYYQTSATNSSYTWAYPAIEGPAIFRVHDYSDASVESISDEVNFIPNSDLIITSPNGGETWEVGTVQNITWASAGVSYVDIFYSTDAGLTWIEIDDYDSSDGLYSWQVPNTVTGEALIRIRNYQHNGCEHDYSDAAFTIELPEPRVTAPNGGETYYINGSVNVSWTASFFDDSFVVIEWSSNNGVSWETLSVAESNDGSFSWTPNQTTDAGLIRVTSLSDPSLTDISDAVFSVNPSIVVTSPNGDNGIQDWRVCTETSITWLSGGTSNYFKIRYSLDNGNTWITLNSNYYSPGFFNSFDWVMPNTPTPAALVQVEDRYNPLQIDESDEVFTIAPAITVTSPNGNESFASGQEIDILWENNGATNFVDIDYSDDGGASWNNIAFNELALGSTYPWIVPSIESEDYIIRVTDHVDNCKADVSDAGFSVGGVIPGAISVTYPMGGELWESCTTELITWDASNTSDRYDLEYSIDFGVSWTIIVEDFFSLDGSYAWTLPNENSSDVFVRVVDHFNANTKDENNLPVILDGVIAFAGEDQAVCLGESLFLQASGGVNYSWSPALYLSNTEGSTALCTPLTSQTYTVTVTDENGCVDADDVSVVIATDLCVIEGCTDPEAYNYNSDAVIDNGFCLYINVSGACPADLSGNGFIDTADLLIVLGGFASECP